MTPLFISHSTPSWSANPAALTSKYIQNLITFSISTATIQVQGSSIFHLFPLLPSQSVPNSQSEWSCKYVVSSLLISPHYSKLTSLRVNTKGLQWSKTQYDLALGYVFHFTSISSFACSVQPHQQPHCFSSIPASGPLHLLLQCTCHWTSNTLPLDGHIVIIVLTSWSLLHSHLVSENLPGHTSKIATSCKNTPQIPLLCLSLRIYQSLTY